MSKIQRLERTANEGVPYSEAHHHDQGSETVGDIGRATDGQTAHSTISEPSHASGAADQSLPDNEPTGISLNEGTGSAKLKIARGQNGDPLDAAVAQIRKAESLTVQGRQASFKALSLLYPVFIQANEDKAFYEVITARAKLRLRKDTPRELGIVKAVHTLANKTAASSTQHDWSKVLRAAQVTGIEATTSAMDAWLAHLQADKSKPGNSVFKAAEAILNPPADRESQPESGTQRDILESLAAEGEAASIGSVQPRDGSACPEGFWMSLNFGDRSLRVIEDDEKAIRAFVTKRKRKLTGSGDE